MLLEALLAAGYAGGWLVTAVVGARLDATKPRCHGEARDGHHFTWSDKADCEEYCRPGCWRVNDGPTMAEATRWSCLALFWPGLVLGSLLVFPKIVQVLASRPSRIQALTAKQQADQEYIARLERELGIKN